jgi:hypothetical protein
MSLFLLKDFYLKVLAISYFIRILILMKKYSKFYFAKDIIILFRNIFTSKTLYRVKKLIHENFNQLNLIFYMIFSNIVGNKIEAKIPRNPTR